jgi:hypothetical protein
LNEGSLPLTISEKVRLQFKILWGAKSNKCHRIEWKQVFVWVRLKIAAVFQKSLDRRT